MDENVDLRSEEEIFEAKLSEHLEEQQISLEAEAIKNTTGIIYKEISYTTKYNLNLRPISNTQITTVEISPTGSGKTEFYKNSPYTIMLMPTNALVKQNHGITAGTFLEENNSFETFLDTTKCNYMTYSKFAGHVKNADFSKWNIIWDEAHLILTTIDERYLELIRLLMLRKIEYKELKLVSATIRAETLCIFASAIQKNNPNNPPIDVIKYIDTNRSLHLNFVNAIPKYEKGIKTLFFVNSKMKMIQVKEFYKKIDKTIKVAFVSAQEDERPKEEVFQKNDIILSTCVIKEGYSIATYIDRVIIYNVFNSDGATGILQYAARVRNNQPDIYVVSASTHFGKEKQFRPKLSQLEYAVKKLSNKDEEFEVNKALDLHRLAKYTKDTKDKWKRAGLAKYYEELMNNYELYSPLDIGMKRSISQLLPNAGVEYMSIQDKNKIDEIKFTKDKFDFSDCNNLSELRMALLDIENGTKDDIIKHKAQQYMKKPFKIVFKGLDKNNNEHYYKFTDKILVRQINEPKINERCRQHVENLEHKVYLNRDKGDQRNRPKKGDIIKHNYLDRKMSFAKNSFKTKLSGLDLAKKLYSFDWYADEACTEKIKDGLKSKMVCIKITSIYSVETNWYDEISQEEYETFLDQNILENYVKSEDIE